MGLTHDISIIKQQYRELFELAHKRLETVFADLHGQYHCSQCNTSPQAILDVLHEGCGFRAWQQETILTLEQTIGRQIVDALDRIEAEKNVKGACHMCGVCCSLASSEFSYQQLLDKAKQGDDFARQFTSVFLPYESHEAAQAKFPDLVGEIVTQTDGAVHFYHCPHLTTENKCGLYNDPRRPEICATYPETPLILMYKNCGYQPWKSELMPTTLWAHATLELCHYYSNRILEALKAPGSNPKGV